MRILFLLTSLAFALSASAQTNPDSTCKCSKVFTIQYPKVAKKAKASGTVMIEFEENEDCTWSKPIVIQKAGYGLDEEALRVMNQTILFHNSCVRKCSVKSCEKRSLKRPFTFKYYEE